MIFSAKAQVMPYQYHITKGKSSFFINNNVEPTALGNDSLGKISYIEVRNKNGVRLGWVNKNNNYFYISKNDSSKIEIDTLRNFTSYLCIIPDNKFDSIYHLVAMSDSLVSKYSYVRNAYIFHTILHYYNKQLLPLSGGLKLIGKIKSAGAYIDSNAIASNNIIREKTYTIILDRNFKYFQLITLTTDSQEIYNCDFDTVQLISKSYFKITGNLYDLHIDPFLFLYDGSFCSRNIILMQYPEIGYTNDTSSYYCHRLFLMRLSENYANIDTIYQLDSMPYYRKAPSKTKLFNNSFYANYALSENDSFVYIAYNKEDYNYNHLLEIYQYNTINHQRTNLFDTTILENRTTPHGYNFGDNGLFNISNHPSGRLYLYVNCTTAIVINKPNLPYPYCKIYRNFPILVCDSSFYKNMDSTEQSNFYIPVGNNYFPIHFNKTLSTLEKINCKSAILYAHGDTSYKTFQWYVWNKLTNSFDSSSGTSCYITDISNGVYYKLKGMSSDGYFAWFADSIFSQMPPFAFFKAVQEQHCQYSKIKFIDSSYSKNYSPYIPYNWHWYFGDGTDTIIYVLNTSGNIGLGNIEHIYNKSGYYQVKLIFYNGLCSDTFTSPQSIYIAPAPQAGIVLNPNNSCVHQKFNIVPMYYDSIISERYDIYNTTFAKHDSSIYKPGITSKPQGYSFTLNDTGNYFIKQTLTGVSGCVTKDSIYIPLNTRPSINLPQDTFICADEELILSVSAGYSKYKWNTGDTATFIRVRNRGEYGVEVYNGNCKVKDSIIVNQYMDESCKLHISVYPNPFGASFYISSYARYSQNMDIFLYDARGRQVAAYNAVPINQFNSFEIPTLDLPASLYILRIQTQQKDFIYKLVKLGN